MTNQFVISHLDYSSSILGRFYKKRRLSADWFR